MIRRYPDAEATMGEGRLVGETGPDEAGKNLSPTTVKVRFDLQFLHFRKNQMISISMDVYLIYFVAGQYYSILYQP